MMRIMMGFPQAGETITYNFNVVNTGNVTISNILVTDPKVTVNGGPVSVAAGTNDSSTFFATYIITQTDVDTGSISNTATVNGMDPTGGNITDTSDDPNNPADADANGDGEPDDTTVTQLTSNSVLRLTKIGTFIDTNNDGLAQAGETITYTFDVKNTGNVTISNITVTDPLTPVSVGSITLVPDETDFTTFTATYTLTQGDVNNGSVMNIASTSGMDPSGMTISDSSDDPTTNAVNDATVTVLPRLSELSLFKTSVFDDQNDDGIPQVGETITYTFDVRNSGNLTITNITVTDPRVSLNWWSNCFFRS